MTLSSDYPFEVDLPASEREVDLVFELVDGRAADLPADPVYIEGRRADGRPSFEFYALEDRDVVRITGAMDFHCHRDRIVCYLLRSEQRHLVEIALLGMVMSLWLERRGTPTLHASAAVIGDRVVAFLGRGKGGKTSLASACVAAGHALLTDDLLALGAPDGEVLAHPGYPSLRMWPEQARHFVGSGDRFPAFHPEHDKRRVAVGAGFGTFAESEVPVGRLYVTERADTPDVEIAITPLRAREAAIALVRNSFLPQEVVRYGIQGSRLAFFAQLLHRVKVCRLTVPSGLDELPRVVAALEADIAASA